MKKRVQIQTYKKQINRMVLLRHHGNDREKGFISDMKDLLKADETYEITRKQVECIIKVHSQVEHVQMMKDRKKPILE